MASGSSTYATSYDAATSSRTGGPSVATRELNMKYITDVVTLTTGVLTGNDTYLSGDYYDLGPAGFEGYVIPNLSFISYDTGSTGTLTNAFFVLAKYNSTDGAVVISGECNANGLVADYFADFAAATTWPSVQKGDRLRLYLANTEGTYTNGRTLRVNVACLPKHVS